MLPSYILKEKQCGGFLMPRGANRTVEVRIAEIDARIAKKENEIKELKAQRAELLDTRQAELAAKVVKLAAEKGVSIEDILKEIEKK
jgi:Skp family chaperone for outer membrane proteins